MERINEMISNCMERDNYVHSVNMGIARGLGWDAFRFDETNRCWMGKTPGGIESELPDFTADPAALQRGINGILDLFYETNASETLKRACVLSHVLELLNSRRFVT